MKREIPFSIGVGIIALAAIMADLATASNVAWQISGDTALITVSEPDGGVATYDAVNVKGVWY